MDLAPLPPELNPSSKKSLAVGRGEYGVVPGCSGCGSAGVAGASVTPKNLPRSEKSTTSSSSPTFTTSAESIEEEDRSGKAKPGSMACTWRGVAATSGLALLLHESACSAGVVAESGALVDDCDIFRGREDSIGWRDTPWRDGGRRGARPADCEVDEARRGAVFCTLFSCCKVALLTASSINLSTFRFGQYNVRTQLH